MDGAEGAREVFQRSRVPHADPMYRQAPTCSDGHSFRWKTSWEGPRDGQDPRAPYGALMRGVPEPVWHELQAPDEVDVAGICASPLESRMRMSALARLRAAPE